MATLDLSITVDDLIVGIRRGFPYAIGITRPDGLPWSQVMLSARLEFASNHTHWDAVLDDNLATWDEPATATSDIRDQCPVKLTYVDLDGVRRLWAEGKATVR